MPIVEIILARPGDLLPHEEPQPPRVLEVASSIMRTGYLFRPIIVEHKSHMIIDGHHRVEALKRLGAKRIPVVEARYGVEVPSLKPVLRALPTTSTSIHGVEGALDLIESLMPGSTPAILIVGGRALQVRVSLEEAYRKTVPSAPGSRIMLRLPPLQPASIIRAAMRGELYPPKTTNHETPLKKTHHPVRIAELL